MRRFSKLLLAGFMLVAISAQSDDNTLLYVCKSDSPEAGRGLFSGDVSASKVKKTVLTIGQDNDPNTPLFEVKYEGFDGRGKSVAGPITVRRVALAKNDAGSVSVTYAATRSSGRQRASVFNVLIPPTLDGKLTFTQQNNRGAPSHPKFDLDCEAKSEDLRLPQTVELEKYSEPQQVLIIGNLQGKLPNKTLYLRDEDSEDKRPTDLVEDVEGRVATQINGLSVDAETLRKKLHLDNSEAKIDWAEGARCAAAKIYSLRTVRDMTGKNIAYQGSLDCTNASIVVTYPPNEKGEVRTAKFRLGLEKVYVTPARVLFQSATLDFDRVYDKEEE